ncbi:MAG: 2-phosphosulfolactate phosphatase [Ignavibacteria bacterium]|nr:2-phosphosulfolactate phosphatase [Ignavibacteria bacterium]
MKADVTFSALQLDELQVRDKNLVMVDVLRSSSSIVHALHNGAREIIPVATIENAAKVSGTLFGDVTLRGGERNGRMIQGFNLGNSPSEYSEANVKGKSIIFCSTNGSVALVKGRHARKMVVGGFNNVSKVVEFLQELNEDFLILCAGRSPVVGGFSLEDTVCAGMIIDRLLESKNPSVETTDAALAARKLFRSLGRSIPRMLKNSEHGKYLIEIGFKEDLKTCGAVDSVPVLPIWTGNNVRLKREMTESDDGAPNAAKPSP